MARVGSWKKGGGASAAVGPSPFSQAPTSLKQERALRAAVGFRQRVSGYGRNGRGGKGRREPPVSKSERQKEEFNVVELVEEEGPARDH